MMQNVEFNRSMEEIPTYKTEIAVYGTARAAKKWPGSAGVVREYGVGMLQKCDSNWKYVSQEFILSTAKFEPKS